MAKERSGHRKKRPDLAGVVLAGGANRRMGGRLKALLPWNGQTILQRQLDELCSLCGEIMIVAGSEARKLELVEAMQPFAAADGKAEVSIICDRRPGEGPLAGMEAALLATSKPLLWVVGCDMPFISAAAADKMADHLLHTLADAVVPQLDGKIHPLHGLYRRSCLHAIQSQLNQGRRKVTDFLTAITTEYVERSFFGTEEAANHFACNVNCPEEYTLWMSDDRNIR